MSANNSTPLEEVSLAFMRAIWPSSAIVFALEVFNFAICCIGLEVLSTNGVFVKANTFLFVRCMFFNDLITCLYEFGYQGWHFANLFFAVPEVMPIKRCFYVTFVQIYILITSQAMDLLVAVDRLISLVSPDRYLKFPRLRYWFTIFMVNVFSVFCCVSSHWDTFPDATLTYCSFRAACGYVWQYLVWVIMLSIDTTTVLVYVAILVVARLKINDTQPFYKPGSVEAVTNKMMKKVTKVSIASGSCYFVVGPLNVFSTLMFKLYFPQFTLSVGQYFAGLLFSGSTIYFVNFCIFLSDFREGVMELFGVKMGV